MSWVTKFIKMFGSMSCFTAPLVQLASDCESDQMKKDIDKLLDPITNLHPDIKSLSEELYNQLVEVDEKLLLMNDDFFHKYLRPLSLLEAEGAIKFRRNMNKSIPQGLFLIDTGFVLYLCRLFADNKAMQALFDKIENCKSGEWLCRDKLKEELNLPSFVIEQVFSLYANKGYGLLSGPVDRVRYMSKT
ncbi:MAG: hypothetical protein GX569_12410 [Candidatus Riflebacteria bacterium]|nr:hypothetical protein [Candidatus Riflebacteria bacterium]